MIKINSIYGWMIALALLVVAFMAGSMDKVFAAPRRAPTPTQMPKDLTQVDIYLHTVDVGQDIYAKFGHTAVRIHDRAAGTDQVYNLGIFDFSDPFFVLNFYRGILRYQMADYPYSIARRLYQVDGRQAWQDRLRLTTEQKRRLLDRIIWQSQPENRAYDYQYFFDNCSTRVRDFFDYALDGAFARYFADQTSDESFRDTVRSHMASSSFFAMSLDILMNARLDRPMTKWEEMYLPLRLRAGVLAMPAVDDAGNLVTTERLGESTDILVVAPSPPADRVHAYVWAMAAFIVPLVIVWLLGLRAKFFKPSTEAYNRACRGCGLILIFWGLWAGSFGLLMASTWLFSAHLDLHHNANLWLFFPTDLILVYIGIKWLRYGYAAAGPDRAWTRVTYWYVRLHLVALGCLVGGWLTGTIKQDVQPVLLSYGVISVMIFSLVILLQRSQRVG